MKTDWSSYLHLSNILSSWVELSSWIIESSFSTWFKFLNSTSQLDSTLFQENFNLTRHFSSRVLDLTRSVYFQLNYVKLYKRSIELICLKNNRSSKKERISTLDFWWVFFLNDLKNTIRSFLFQMKDKTEWDLFLVNELNISWLLVNEREIILLLVSRWETELLLSSEWETRLLLASELKTKLLLSSE